MNRIPILSFFSGAGFLDLGFHNAGFDMVFSNEISKAISKVYKSGMSSCLGSDLSITSNKSIEEFSAHTINRIKQKHNIKKIWGMIGGPPCPDFSIAGKNKGHTGENGKLTQIFVNLICEASPSFFVIENVKGLIKTKKHKPFFEKIIHMFEENNYAIDYKILNSLELGVPQNRERVFIVGIKKKIFKRIFKTEYIANRNWFYWPYCEKYNNAKNKYEWPKINTFGAKSTKSYNAPAELMVGTYILDHTLLKKIPNSDEYFQPKSSKFLTVEEGNDKNKSFKRLHSWRYSPTAAYGNNEVHLHPTLPRRLSVREALRIQSVPDTYIIDKEISLTTKFKAIGNGVPVKMASLLANSFNDLINQYKY